MEPRAEEIFQQLCLQIRKYNRSSFHTFQIFFFMTTASMPQICAEYAAIYEAREDYETFPQNGKEMFL